MANEQIRLGFIGFGNMAQAIARGLVGAGALSGERITACAAHFDKLQRTAKEIGVNAVETAAEVVEASDFIVIAVKPYLVEHVIEPVREALAGKVVVSVAFGCYFDFFERILDPSTHHISTIPNTPIAVGAGVVSCEQRHSLTEEEFAAFSDLFGQIALIESMDTKLLSVASDVAGCGPAFTALYVEALADAAVKHGMQRPTAYRLASQMIVGTGRLQLATGKHPGELKDAVCSPGGTTIKGVTQLEKSGFRGAVIDAIDAIENA